MLVHLHLCLVRRGDIVGIVTIFRSEGGEFEQLETQYALTYRP